MESTASVESTPAVKPAATPAMESTTPTVEAAMLGPSLTAAGDARRQGYRRSCGRDRFMHLSLAMFEIVEHVNGRGRERLRGSRVRAMGRSS